MKEVRLDLFQLHDEDDRGQGRIKVELNENIRILLKNMVKDIKNNSNLKIKDISNFVGLPYYEFWRCLNQKHIPLNAVEKLIQLWCKTSKNTIYDIKKNVQDCIENLSHGAGNTFKIINSPKSLTEDLCKIVGAVVADGHLSYRKAKNTMTYTVVVRDGSKDNIDLFCKWIKNEFGIKLKARYSKNDNHWYACFGNKIIFRYLNKVFEIPFGKKSDTVRMPEIIYNSPLSFQRSFVSGVLMFDGGIDHRTGYFDLSTKSKFLVKDVENALIRYDIKPDYVSNRLDPISGVYKLRIRSKRKLKKLLNNFIEPNTIKWMQLNLHVNSFNEKIYLDDLITKLNSTYPRVRDGITFEDVINIVKENEFVTSKQMQRKLNRRKTVVYEYLKRLEDWKILTSNKSKGKINKVWSINPNLKTNERR